MTHDPIVRREFTIGRDGKRRLEALVYAPVPDRMDFRCDYEIREDGVVTRAFHAYGVDSMQAMILALQQLGVDIMMSEHVMKRELYLHGENKDFGLLLPKSFTD